MTMYIEAPTKKYVPAGKATLYELAVWHADGRKYLIAYTNRRVRDALFNAVCNRAEHMRRITGEASITFAKRAQDGATMGEWKVNWTGRTQRDACSHGELPFIAVVY